MQTKIFGLEIFFWWFQFFNAAVFLLLSWVRKLLSLLEMIVRILWLRKFYSLKSCCIVEFAQSGILRIFVKFHEDFSVFLNFLKVFGEMISNLLRSIKILKNFQLKILFKLPVIHITLKSSMKFSSFIAKKKFSHKGKTVWKNDPSLYQNFQ